MHRKSLPGICAFAIIISVIMLAVPVHAGFRWPSLDTEHAESDEQAVPTEAMLSEEDPYEDDTERVLDVVLAFGLMGNVSPDATGQTSAPYERLLRVLLAYQMCIRDRRRDARLRHDGLAFGFIKRARACFRTGAGMTNALGAQHALNGAVLAEAPVHRHERNISIRRQGEGGIRANENFRYAMAARAQGGGDGRAGAQRNFTLGRWPAQQNGDMFEGWGIAHGFISGFPHCGKVIGHFSTLRCV